MEATTTEHPVEVRVYRYGLLRLCEWCPSATDADGVAAMWEAQGGVRCEIVTQ